MSGRALARATEAERLALESPPGAERELYVQIAFLWRELAQMALARELCSHPPEGIDAAPGVMMRNSRAVPI
ncbi:MAG TPA: hypothetical protein VF699_05645 [Caulobacteraceae bacterium]